MNQKVSIDDPWVLSRTGGSSRSFSDFLMKLASKAPENDRKELEKAAQVFGDRSIFYARSESLGTYHTQTCRPRSLPISISKGHAETKQTLSES
jgi:hypothetical protein